MPPHTTAFSTGERDLVFFGVPDDPASGDDDSDMVDEPLKSNQMEWLFRVGVRRCHLPCRAPRNPVSQRKQWNYGHHTILESYSTSLQFAFGIATLCFLFASSEQRIVQDENCFDDRGCH